MLASFVTSGKMLPFNIIFLVCVTITFAFLISRIIKLSQVGSQHSRKWIVFLGEGAWVLRRMLVLREPQQLQILYDSLGESTPESLKVYGALFHIRNKNPFNLEVLVDAWPGYQTVVIRPQKEEMKDDLDYYINTYHIFTKAPDKLEEILACPQVINWEQAFQIQGCQESLGKALQKVAASKSVQVDYLRTILFVFEKPTFAASSGDKMDLVKLLQVPTVLKDKRKETFQSTFLDVSHARIVNEHWELGKNEKSLKYVERCLQNFAGFGILNSEGNPVSWVITEQSCEIRMGYTIPKYQGQGHMWQLGCQTVAYFFSKNIPFYLHVSEDKEKTQQIAISFGFKNALCGWHQWKCTPKKYC